MLIVITIKVLPQHDGDGINSALLHWAFNHLGLEMETIWALESRIESRAYFEFGWTTVDVINIDLAKWAKEERRGIYQKEELDSDIFETGNQYFFLQWIWKTIILALRTC